MSTEQEKKQQDNQNTVTGRGMRGGSGMGRGGQCRRDSTTDNGQNGGPDGVCRRQGGQGRGVGRGLGRKK